jgi:hypothetical protein
MKYTCSALAFALVSVLLVLEAPLMAQEKTGTNQAPPAPSPPRTLVPPARSLRQAPIVMCSPPRAPFSSNRDAS